MRYCIVVDEVDLPALYHRWARAVKAERRIAFQALLDERARQQDAATAIAPFVTKELHETVLMGRIAPKTHEMEDLGVGLNPFSCGFQNSEKDREVVIRAQNMDLMLQGHTQPTLAEQETFKTKEVPVPTTIYEAGLQIKATSVTLDVVLGVHAPLSQSLRRFCWETWPTLEAHLNLSSEDHTPILPLILRKIQLEMSAYLQAINQGRPVVVPSFQELEWIVTAQAFHQFAPMPSKYRVVPETPAPPSRGAPPSGGGGNNPRVDNNHRDPGQQVENDNHVAALQEAFTNSGTRIAQLREHAPTTTDQATNTTVPICLSYHLRGTCYANCQRASTHRALTAGERRRMMTFASQYMPAQQRTTDNPPAAAANGGS